VRIEKPVADRGKAFFRRDLWFSLAADIQVFRLGRLRWTNEAGPNCCEGSAARGVGQRSPDNHH